MACHRRYDTVAFDVRDNAVMLFFARTSDTGDIVDYLLLMRGNDRAFRDSVYIEVNEEQLAGHDLVQEARLDNNMLTLVLTEPAPALDGASELIASYDGSASNRASVEAGAFRVLGDRLAGGHA